MLFAQPLKLIAAVLVGTLVYNFVSAEDAVRTGLVIFSVVACLWLTEAIHISITALLIPVLAVFGGIFSVKEALINFANPIIFL
ncbi:MAG: Anion transporter, partial [Sinobacterium sp.]|nr:Anion transporter [Sinobacterium sp.]